LFLGTGEHNPGTLYRAHQQRAEISVRMLTVMVSSLPGDFVYQCQYRPRLGLGYGAACVLGSGPKTLDQIIGKQALLVLATIGKSLEKLCNDGTGIAPRAIERGVCNPDQQFPRMARMELLDTRSDRIGSCRKIRARITIGNREHVDLIELVLRTDERLDAGAQTPLQTNTIQVSDTGGSDHRNSLANKDIALKIALIAR